MDSENKFINKPYFLVAIIVIIFSIIITLYWTFFRKPVIEESSQDLKSLEDICSNISTINNDFTLCIDGQSIDSTKTISLLESNIPKLDEVSTNLNTINLSKKNENLKTYITQSLKYNISVYDNLLKILKAPEKEDAFKSFISLQEEKDSFFNSLNSFNDTAIDYSLSKDTEIFINNSISYSKELIKLNRDLSITKVGTKDYIISLSPLYDSLNDISTDLFSSIEDSKSDKDALKRMENNVYKKILNLSTIKTNFVDISVPNNCLENYSLFNTSLESCQEYLNLLSEQLKNSIDANSETDYSKSQDAYNTFKSDLNEFYSNYYKLK